MKKRNSKTTSRSAQKQKAAAIAAGIPIGGISFYAGSLQGPEALLALRQSGWLLCDGASYETSLYKELYLAIANASGGDKTRFNVPDLRGRFLRGTLKDGPGTDPDAAQRIPAAPGGNPGNQTGSLQLTATANPKSNWRLQEAGEHFHSSPRLGGPMRLSYGGTNMHISADIGELSTSKAGSHSHDIKGFDEKTLPKRLALHVIIKAEKGDLGSGICPAGMILGFAGTENNFSDQWLRCSGQAIDNIAGESLREIIGTNFGGELSLFNLPDLRGNFLRGTDPNAKIDTDGGERHPLMPGGNKGVAVGSAQDYATRRPDGATTTEAPKHHHKISHVPLQGGEAARAVSDTLCLQWSNDSAESRFDGLHFHTVVSGGDKETRPENVYVDFVILNRDISAISPPVGTIASFGGDFTKLAIRKMLEDYGWLPCDGTLAEIAKFQDLFKVIGNIYGPALAATEAQYFKLPDLAGLFIMGAGSLPVGSKFLDSRTGPPAAANPLVSSIDGDHSHVFTRVPKREHVTTAFSGDAFGYYNTGEVDTSEAGNHFHQMGEADAESRPVNVNMNFIIRAI